MEHVHLDIVGTLPTIPVRERTGHKGTYGTVLGISGCRGMAGAVALAGKAALFGGAGLVRLAVPDPILETVAAFFPELTTIPCPADSAGRFAPDSFETLKPQIENASTVFLGPGLGRSAELNNLVKEIIGHITCLNKFLVVDADGLNALAAEKVLPSENRDNSGIVLTPHAGEFFRLTGKPAPDEELIDERIAAAVQFAKQWNVVLVLKGHRTITTDGKQVALNTTGNPGMATGGSGDVLTGLIAGLLAQQCFSAFDAARLGVHIHGLAGDLGAEHFGEMSLTATGILEHIPAAVKHFCLERF
ncbi:MAG: NAD(P)H-hydrate dehydratase [Planctomycetaceae bacterium]|nr:NAD(P)H-hydrate dehydratase [Planctomycetaceae bacterium]